MCESTVESGKSARRAFDVKDSEIRLNVTVKILPFGHVVIQTKSSEQVGMEKMERKPVYAEPRTTDTKMFEIAFGGENYIVPKTTGGLL